MAEDPKKRAEEIRKKYGIPSIEFGPGASGTLQLDPEVLGKEYLPQSEEDKKKVADWNAKTPMQKTGSFIGDMGEKLASGTLSFLQGTLYTPGVIQEIANIPYDMMMKGALKKQARKEGMSEEDINQLIAGYDDYMLRPDMGAVGGYSTKNTSSFKAFKESAPMQTMNKWQEDLNGNSDRLDESIWEYFKTGRYGKAFGKSVLGAVESLPATLGAAFGGEAGIIALGVSSGAQQYDQLDENNKDMGEVAKAVNALGYGFFEAATEKWGSKEIADWIKSEVKRVGKESAEAAVKNGFEKILRDAYKKAGLFLAPVHEGISEAANQIAGNAISIATGEDPDRGLFDGAFDALAIGSATGFGFAGAGSIAKKRAENNVKERINQYGEKLKFGDTPLLEDPNPIVSFANTKNGQKVILKKESNLAGDNIFMAFDAETNQPVMVKATDVIDRKDIPYSQWLKDEMDQYKATKTQLNKQAAAEESPIKPGQTIDYNSKKWNVTEVGTDGTLAADEITEDGIGEHTEIPITDFNKIAGFENFKRGPNTSTGPLKVPDAVAKAKAEEDKATPKAREITDGKLEYTVSPNEDGSFSIDKVFNIQKEADATAKKLGERFQKLDFQVISKDSGDAFTEDEYRIIATPKNLQNNTVVQKETKNTANAKPEGEIKTEGPAPDEIATAKTDVQISGDNQGQAGPNEGTVKESEISYTDQEVNDKEKPVSYTDDRGGDAEEQTKEEPSEEDAKYKELDNVINGLVKSYGQPWNNSYIKDVQLPYLSGSFGENNYPQLSGFTQEEIADRYKELSYKNTGASWDSSQEKSQKTGIIKQEKPKKPKKYSRSAQLTSREPESFEEAVLQFFVGGGRVKTNDFIRFMGINPFGKEGYIWAVKKSGKAFDAFHEDLPEGFHLDGGIDEANEIVRILRKYPKINYMMDALEALQKTQPALGSTEENNELELDEREEEVIQATESILEDSDIDHILREFSKDSGDINYDNLLIKLSEDPGYFTTFPYALKEDQLENFKEELNEQRRRNSSIETKAQEIHSPDGESEEEVPNGGTERTTVRAGREESATSESEPEPERKSESEVTPSYGQSNTVFTADAAARAREILRRKLGNLNVGLDPETLQAGITLAGYHIEAGARKFADYSRAMVQDLGEAVKPYLKSFYYSVRSWPGFNNEGMDSFSYVEETDIDSIFETRQEKEEKSTKKTEETSNEMQLAGEYAIPEEFHDTDYPSKGLVGPVKKDVTRFSKELAKILGWDHKTDKKGKPKYANINIAPAGGEASLFLQRPDRDYGVYVSIPIGPTEMADNGYFEDIYKIEDIMGFGKPILYRIENNKGKMGQNLYAPATISAGQMASLIKSAAESYEKSFSSSNLEDNKSTGNDTEAGDTSSTSNGMVPGQDSLPGDVPASLTDLFGPAGETPGGSNGVQSASVSESEKPDAKVERSGRMDDSREGNVSESESTTEETANAGEPASGDQEQAGDNSGGGEISDKEQESDVQGNDLNAHNHVISPDDVIAPRGEIAKITANLQAIRLLHQLEKQDRNATPEEKKKLASFTGWGGLATVLDAEKARQYESAIERGYGMYSDVENWGKKYFGHYQSVRKLLTDEEFINAVNSTITAYYTPSSVIRKAWKIAERLGFQGGSVLDPGAGVGHFFGLAPDEIASKSSFRGYELDSITGRILSKLYPEGTMRATGYENAVEGPGTIDLIMTNVPFGQTAPFDAKNKDLKGFSLHNYFIAKGLRQLKPGGVGVFITSKTSMDSPASARFREWVTNEGSSDLIGAIRLPNNTFSENAGTEVTSDILVFQKRLSDSPSPYAESIRSTGELLKTQTQAGKETTIDINEYFLKHPEMMLGKMALAYQVNKGGLYSGDSETLSPVKGQDTDALLGEAISRFPENIMALTSGAGKEVKGTKEGDKEGTIIDRDDTIYEVDGGELHPVAWNNESLKSGKKFIPYKTIAREYLNIKQLAKDLLASELSKESSEKDISDIRQKLNEAYDDFVKNYGNFNRNNKLEFLEDDSEYNLVAALEDVKRTIQINKGGNPYSKFEIIKSEVFDKRVNFPTEEPTEAGNVADALSVSVSYRGKLDLEYIASLVKSDVETVKKDLLDGELAYINPSTSLLEDKDTYLSGYVRTKLKVAEELSKENPDLLKNVEALKKVVPKDIPGLMIKYKLGTPWIPGKAIEKFIKETIDIDCRVEYVQSTGVWRITDIKNQYNAKNQGTFATTEFTAIELIDKYMNLHTPVVIKREYDPITRQKTERRDPEATAAAQGKMEELADLFLNWMPNQKEDMEQIETIYNEKYNDYIEKKFSKPAFDNYPGANKTITLRQHQSKAVGRILKESTLLAHQVGTGKTFTMITAAMEMRRLGIAKKPMVVVQNSTLEQFGKDFKKLYPGAKILVPSKTQMETKGRQKLLNKIAYGDWDAVVIPHSFLGFIPDDPKREKEYIKERIAELEDVLSEVDDGTWNNAAANDTKKAIEKLEEALVNLDNPKTTKKKKVKDQAKANLKTENKILSQANRRRDDVVLFEKMGVDALFIDEAHAFKKLGFATAQTNVKGIDTKGSQRALSLNMKVRFIHEQMGKKNVVFATGTPITNTMAEVWTMMKYLSPDLMKTYKIERFDDFARIFGSIEPSLEFNASGNFKNVNRFKSYVNAPELLKAFRSVADVVLTEDVQEFKEGNNVPKLKGGDFGKFILPQTSALKNQMDEFKSILLSWEQLPGKEKRLLRHIPVVVFQRAKQAAIDLRLLDPDNPDDPGNKTNAVVKEALRISKETEKYKGTQAIFSDMFQSPKVRGSVLPRFNLYYDIKKKLIEAGVPASEIEIVSNQKGIKLEAIFEKVRTGEIRFIMGSTQRIGTGVNFQDLLKAVHHVDAPQMPKDFEQRNGRIIRQGNMHAVWGEPVEVVTYGVEKTLDATAYQRLAIKQKFINQMMKAENLEREMNDESDENQSDQSFDAMMSQLSGSQYAILWQKKSFDLRKLRTAKANYERNLIETKKNLKDAKLYVQHYTGSVKEIKRNIETFEKVFPQNELTTIEINGSKADGKEAILKRLDVEILKYIAYVKSAVEAAKPFLIKVNGYEVPVEAKYYLAQEKFFYELIPGGTTVGSNALKGSFATSSGFISSLQSQLKSYPDELRYNEGKLKRNEDNIPIYEEALTKSFDKQETLEKTEKEVAELEVKMQQENKAEKDQIQIKEGGLEDLQSELENLEDNSEDESDDEEDDSISLRIAEDEPGIQAEIVDLRRRIKLVQKARDAKKAELARRMALQSSMYSVEAPKVVQGSMFDTPQDASIENIQRILADFDNQLAGMRDMLRRLEISAATAEKENQGQRYLFRIDDSIYFSNTEKALEAIMQERGTPDQFKAMLIKNGAKQAEMEWMGFDEFVAGKKSVTKTEIQSWINHNKIELKEIVDPKAGQPEYPEEITQEDLNIQSIRQIPERDVWEITFRPGGITEVEEIYAPTQEEAIASLLEGYNNPIYHDYDDQEVSGTKYKKYTLPGGEDYKEMRLTIKNKGYGEVPGVDEETILSTYKVETTDENQYTGQRNVIIYDGHGNEVAKRFGTRASDEEILRDEARSLTRENGRIIRELEKKDEFYSGHWNEADIVAHVRFNTRTTTDGRSVLFIEEIQSDWAQKGKREGFYSKKEKAELIEQRLKKIDKEWSEISSHYESALKRIEENIEAINKESYKRGLPTSPSSTEMAKFNAENEDLKEARLRALADRDNARHYFRRAENDYSQRRNEALGMQMPGVPDMPFKQTDQWAGLVLKRMIRHAIDQGFDAISWTPGEIQNERYKLNKFIDKLKVWKHANDLYEVSGSKDGRQLVSEDNIPENRLAEYVGQEMAERAIGDLKGQFYGDVVYEGLNLETGGKGMKGFYDEILPSIANRLSKRYGTRVATGEIVIDDPKDKPVSFAPFTDGINLYNADGDVVDWAYSEEEAQEMIKDFKPKSVLVHTMPVTDGMTNEFRKGVPFFRTLDEPKQQIQAENPIEYIKKEAELKESRRNREIRGRMEMWSKQLGVNITVARDRSEMPERVQKYLAKKAKNKRVPGFYDIAEDQVWVNLHETKDIEDLDKTILHEIVAHKGLRQLLGENRYKSILDDVYSGMSETDIERLAKKYGQNYDKIADEYLAEMAEKNINPGLLTRIIAKIRQMLRRLFKVNFTQDDIHSLLRESRQNLINKSRPKVSEYKSAGEYMDALSAWHGSKYSFRKFDISKVGSQSGLALEGHGLYFSDAEFKAVRFAEKKAQHQGYLNKVKEWLGEDSSVLLSKAFMKARGNYARTLEWIKDYRDKYEQDPNIRNRTDRLFGYIQKHPLPKDRFLYEVQFRKGKALNEFEWIHSDKPLTDHQTVMVSQQMKKEGIDSSAIDLALWDVLPVNGREFYRMLSEKLGSEEKASGFLVRAGIDGMKYINATDTGYVIYNDKAIHISKRVAFRIIDNEKEGSDKGPDNPEKKGPPLDVLRTKKEKRTELWQNKMLSVRKWQNQIKGLGGKITEFSNPYRQENLSHGAVKAAIEKYDEKQVAELLNATAPLMTKADMDYTQVNEYMQAKHAPERNAEIALQKMAENLQMQYDEIKTAYEQKLLAPDIMEAIRSSVNSGMSTEDAERIVAKYESRMTPEMIENFWDAVRGATKFTVDRWLNDGFIDPKQHARITSMYKYYVPLRSWKQTDADKFFSYQSEDVGKSVNPMRKAQGRKSLADDPMQFIVNMAHTAVVMGEKNRIKQHAARLVNENKDMKDLHRFKKIYAVWDGTTDPETGKKNYVEVLERPEKEMWDNGMVMMKYDMAHVKGRPKSKAQEHEVDVFIGGEKYTLVLPADVANALNKTPSRWDNAGFVIRDNVGKYTRWLSANFTSKNPAFIVLNQMRDLQYATLAHFIKGDAKQAALFIKNLRIARKTIIQYIKGKGDPKDPTYKMYQRFLLNGGETGMVHLKDVDQLARELKLDLARLTGTNSTYDKIVHAKILRDLGGWLEHMAIRSENLSRFATYLAAKERGLTDKEAAFQAKEITVNFNRKGRISGLMGSMYAFFNASLQGGENILRMGKEHKAKFFSIGAGAMGIGFLTAMLNDLWGGDDDDENDRYSNINDYVKYNNLVVMFPGTKRHVTIPLPHGFRWFHSLGVLAYQTAMMDDKTMGAAVKDGFSNALASVSPINPVDLIDKKGSFTSRPLWPTSLVPFYDIAVNETYTGAPVHKEPFTQALNGRIANSSLGMKNVNSWVKGFTDAWFKLGHGDPVSGTKFYEDESGKIKPVSNIFDVNPSDVEHVIESILGGRGTFWNDLLKTSQGIMESAHQYTTEDDSFAEVMRDMDVNSFPVLRSLVRQPWNKTVYTEYYDIVNDIENYKSMVGMKNKALEPDQEQREYAPQYQYKIDLLKDLRKDLKEIDEDIEGVTNPKQITELRDVQERLIRNFIEAANKYGDNR